LTVGVCAGSHQSDLIYGGTRYFLKEMAELDLSTSPEKRTFVFQMDENTIIDGQPPWNPQLPYSPGKLQFMNNMVKYVHAKDLLLDHKTKLERSRNGIFTKNAEFYMPRWNKENKENELPSCFQDNVMLKITKEVNPGEELFVDYHWKPKDWKEIGGRLTHSHLQNQQICWRETALIYNYNLKYFYKEQNFN
jgi:hypothetical protein